jgi:2-oxoisovalerate dehydrogenase E1 component alpha subunit
MDLLEVYRATTEAHQRARRGEGPSLIEARVYRFSLHTSQVGAESYRSRKEIEAARQRDPLILLRYYLQKQGLLSDGHLRDLEELVQRTVHDAYTSAEQATVPVGSRQ